MSDTTVSLPDHLRSTLVPLTEILPKDLREQLSLSLADARSEITHSLLLAISKWSRTEEGRSQLRAHALEKNDYGMISLLAGTITAPSSKFSPHIPPPDAAAEARRTMNDRKAITAILNALFSIGGAGYAAWWASGRTHWRDEWRVLFALAVATVVAITEGLLYIIWQTMGHTSRNSRSKLRVQKAKKHQDSDNNVKKLGQDKSNGLRRRQARTSDG